MSSKSNVMSGSGVKESPRYLPSVGPRKSTDWFRTCMECGINGKFLLYPSCLHRSCCTRIFRWTLRLQLVSWLWKRYKQSTSIQELSVRFSSCNKVPPRRLHSKRKRPHSSEFSFRLPIHKIVRRSGVPANAEWTLGPTYAYRWPVIHLHCLNAGPQCIGACVGS